MSALDEATRATTEHREYFGAVKDGRDMATSSYRLAAATYIRPSGRTPGPWTRLEGLPRATVRDDHPLEQGFDQAHLVYHPPTDGSGGITYLVSRPKASARSIHGPEEIS